MAHHQHSLRSVTVVSICSFVQLIVQFAFQLILAKYFGASADMDVYVAALALPTVVSTVLVGSLGYAFVPTFIARRDNTGHVEAWAMASNFGLLLFFVAALLSIAGMVFALPLMASLQPGFSAAQQQQTAELFRILCWLILFNSLISYQQALYHSHQKFALPAIATIIGPVVTLQYTVLFYQYSGISTVATAVILGAIVTVGIQSPLIARHMSFQFRIDSGTKKCLHLLWPLMLGGAYANLGPLVDRYLASSMPTGSISHLGYALRITNALLMVSVGGMGTVMFPSLAVHFAAGRREEFRSEIAHAFRFLCFLTVPIMTGVLCFSHAAVQDVFQRGAFTAEDTHAVAVLLMVYVGVIVGGSFGSIISKVFFALGDTRTPIVIGSCIVTFAILLKFLLAPTMGVIALAATASLAGVAGIILALLVMLRRTGRGVLNGVSRPLIRYAIGSVLGAAAGFLVLQARFHFASLAALTAAVGVYMLFLLVRRDEFAVKFFRFVAAPCPRLFDPESSDT